MSRWKFDFDVSRLRPLASRFELIEQYGLSSIWDRATDRVYLCASELHAVYVLSKFRADPDAVRGTPSMSYDQPRKAAPA